MTISTTHPFSIHVITEVFESSAEYITACVRLCVCVYKCVKADYPPQPHSTYLYKDIVSAMHRVTIGQSKLLLKAVIFQLQGCLAAVTALWSFCILASSAVQFCISAAASSHKVTQRFNHFLWLCIPQGGRSGSR